MTQKSEIGKLGEDLACEYLENKSYRILERNFRKPWGELDIVAKYRDNTLVFVEVKTMREKQELKPEDQMSSAKLKKLRRTALLYAGHNPKLVKDKKGWRIDLVAITLSAAASRLDDCEIKHYENI